MYTCMVSEEGGNTYGEVTVQLIVLGMCATGLLCGLAINCFPKPLAGSAKLWSSLMVKMLVAVGLGRGVFRVLVLSEKNEPLVRGN